MHFDFHASENDKGIGTKTTSENLGKLLDEVKPDYIQVDTKGHPGLTSFFSEYSEDVAPGLENDHLKIIRAETEKRGIALYAHHSGIWDSAACKKHPEWASVNPDGSRHPETIDVTGEYADKKLIPQLKELCSRYGFDGAWVDGECWALHTSWTKEALADFRQKTGFHDIEADTLSDANLAFNDYWREKFKDYVKHYITEVHKEYPDFEITSNFMFSQHMPEKPFAEIDFLSGDSVGADVRITPRCFTGLGKPWDMMSWIMPANTSSFTPKHIDRLCREAAMAISQGGGYQIYNLMSRQGEILLYNLQTLKELSSFVQERKQYLFHSAPLKNTAILLSLYDSKRRNVKNGLYPKLGCGICDAVLDNGLPCDIIYDYMLAKPERNTILLPDLEFISPDAVNQLKNFAEQGGNLIVSGRTSCKLFAKLAGVQAKDFDGEVVYVNTDSKVIGIHEAVVFEGNACRDIVNCRRDSLSSDAQPVSVVVSAPYGNGKIFLIGFELVSLYAKTHDLEEKDIMRRVLNSAVPEPAAYLEQGVRRVEIIPAEKDGIMLVNLINTSEFYYDTNNETADEIPKIHNLTIAVKYSRAPEKVMLEPEHREAAFTYDGKYIHIKVDELHIHTILTIQ